MKFNTSALVCTSTLFSVTAFAALPAGLACDPKIKIVAAEVGEVGEYEVPKGLQKEKHRALLKRKNVTPVDACHIVDLVPGQTAIARYTGEEIGSTEVQCIDQNNNNAPVAFPKSIYTVRNSDISPYMLNPICTDSHSSDGFPCSKLLSQSERSTEYKEVTLKWKENNPKTKQYKVDLVFDPAYVAKTPPYAPSVPHGAKLFCALISKTGHVVLAGTAQYPGAGTGAATGGAPANGTASTATGAAVAAQVEPLAAGVRDANPKESAKEAAKAAIFDKLKR